MNIGLIGCGALGSALLEGWLQANVSHPMCIYDHHPEKAKRVLERYGNPAQISVVGSLEECLANADTIVLCVKPRDGVVLVEKLKTVFARKGPPKMIASAVAGLGLEFMRARIREAALFRFMPNLAVKVGASYTGIYGSNLCVKKMGEEIHALLSPLGKCVWTRDEAHLDALMAVSSCGLAFVSTLLEAWTDAGVAMGLTASESLQAACQTLKGITKLLDDCEKHPGALKWEVTSPAGATIAGLHHLEREGVRGIWMDAILIARQRFASHASDSCNFSDSNGGSYAFQAKRQRLS